MTNVVVIVADTLRDPHGIAGYDSATMTPFLAATLPRGQSYPNFVASAPWTIPSHVALLTGREPWSVVYRGPGGLTVPPGPSLADAWRTATGGETAVWSNNGLVGPLFRTTPGYGAHNRGSSSLWVAGRCTRLFAPVRGRVLAANGIPPPVSLFDDPEGGTPMLHPSVPRQLAYRGMGAMFYTSTRALISGQGVVQGLRTYLHARERGPPLHLLLNLMEVHEPYALLRPTDRSSFPASLYLPMSSLASFQSLLRRVPQVPDLMRVAYLVCLQRLDQRLREVFGALEKGGLLRDALVVLVSDHGQTMGERGCYGHGNSLADELVKVPCTVWRFREGHARPPGKGTSRPFDHRHLHEAIRAFMAAPEAESLTPQLEAALERRGPALAFQEGSPSAFQLARGRVHAPVRIERALRVLDGARDATLELEEADGGLRPNETSSERLPGSLRDEIYRLLKSGRAGSEVGRSTTPEEVDRRLSAWGYV